MTLTSAKTAASIVCLVCLSLGVVMIAFAVRKTCANWDNDLNTFTQQTTATLGNTNNALKAVQQDAEALKPVIVQVGLAIQESRALIAVQKSYQDAQNTRILDILEQVETALINAQGVMDDVNHNQGKVTEATLQQIRQLGPLMQESTKTLQKAGETISDPNIKASLEHIAGATHNIDVGTGAAATTLQRVDKRVEQMMKPASLAKKAVQHAIAWFINVGSDLKNLAGW